MKQFTKHTNAFFVLMFLILSFGCTSEKEDDPVVPIVNNQGNQAIQFYVNPNDFSQGPSGRFIESITINDSDYLPKYAIGNCSEMYEPPVTSSIDGRSYFRYKINMRNYDSLDALMNGWPFAWEYWEGVIYLDDLNPGCNTLEVVAGGGAQLYRLQLRDN